LDSGSAFKDIDRLKAELFSLATNFLPG